MGPVRSNEASLPLKSAFSVERTSFSKDRSTFSKERKCCTEKKCTGGDQSSDKPPSRHSLQVKRTAQVIEAALEEAKVELKSFIQRRRHRRSNYERTVPALTSQYGRLLKGQRELGKKSFAAQRDGNANT